MKRIKRLVYVLVFISIGLEVLHAADLKDGFFDIQWRTDLSQTAGFRKVGENLNVSYFINPKLVYTINDIRIADVVYGAYANQFFAVYINIEAIDVFAQLRRHINHKYGLPKTKIIRMAQPDQQTGKY